MNGDALLIGLEALVISTGQGLLKRLADNEVVCREKSSFQDLVTNEDIRVQEELILGLNTLLPNASIIAEEQDNQKLSGLTWLIDPIDGTTNFVGMKRNYAISVGLYMESQPLLGVVYDVANNESFSAQVGKGAWCNGIPLSPLDQTTDLKQAMVDVSLSSVNNLSRRMGKPLHLISRAIRGHRALGSAALAMCHIARGDIQMYLSAKLYPWDYGAAAVVLGEVGGHTNALFPEDQLFTIKQTPVIACANPLLGEALRTYMASMPSAN